MMTPRWESGSSALSGYQLFHVWAADFYVGPLSNSLYRYGAILSDHHRDRYWADTVPDLMKELDDYWYGHYPDWFGDQLSAIVALVCSD